MTTDIPTAQLSAAATPPRDDDGRLVRRPALSSLAKAMRILEALVGAPEGRSLSEIVERTNLDRTTINRVLSTLVLEGFLKRVSRGRYEVAPRGFALGIALAQKPRLAAAASPYLRQLYEATSHTTNAAILDDREILYVARIEDKRIISVNLDVGSRLPAYCTSLGRALLAFSPRDVALDVLQRSERRLLTDRTTTSVDELLKLLDDVRSCGYALVTGELDTSLRSVAAPILGPSGTAVAAINISVFAASTSEKTVHEELVPPLLATAEAFSRALGFEGRIPGQQASN